MSELEAWQTVKRWAGTEIYIGLDTVELIIDGEKFMADSLIEAVVKVLS